MAEHVLRLLNILFIIAYYLVVKRLVIHAVFLKRLVKKSVRIIIGNLAICLQKLEIELVNVFIKGIGVFLCEIMGLLLFVGYSLNTFGHLSLIKIVFLI